MDTNLFRLPAAWQRVFAAVRHQQYGFDRVHCLLDHAEPPEGFEALRARCSPRVAFRPYAAPYQRLWRGEVELLQPDLETLRRLRAMLAKAGYLAQLQYAELACDFITDDARQADQVGRWWLAHVGAPYARNPVMHAQATYYYHRRADCRGRKTARVLVLYTDKKSKIAGDFAGAPCAHAEWRLWGLATLRHAGLACLDDLLSFDHAAYWTQSVRLALPLSKKHLGEWLSEGDGTSRTTWHHRASNFLRDYELGGAFVLQNALLDDPALRTLLKPIDAGVVFDRWA